MASADGGPVMTRTDGSYKGRQQQLSEKEWVMYIKGSLRESSCQQSAHPPSIFMASSPLRSRKHEDFVPQVVAIGPYHSDLGPHHSFFPKNQETERYRAIAAQEMEKHKVMASKYVEQGLGSRDFGSLVTDFRHCVQQARDEYDTKLALCQMDENLAYMLALDAAFVVEVLRSNAGVRRGFHEYFCSRFPRPLRKSVLQDFVLLENQIPLFLLLKVVQEEEEEECASAEEHLSFLIRKVAHEVLPFSLLSEESARSVLGQRLPERKHLLDCLYGIVTHGGAPDHQWSSDSLLSSAATDVLVQKPTHFPRAVELRNCGISFEGVEPCNVMSVSYDARRAVLYVPKIRVGDDTEKLLRNLIAYESHRMDDEVPVLSYLRFMNSLIDGPDDVALLVGTGVLAQDIGSNEEVADMWNTVCVNTMRVCSVEYERVAQQLLRHCQHRRNALMAEFKQTYLSRPWLLLSVCSGAALLLMTLLILVYTIELYNKKPEV